MSRAGVCLWCPVLAVLAALPRLAEAAGAVIPSAGTADSTVGLFDAVKSGDIDVRLIPQDAAAGTVIITNKTARPLAIKLPEAFASVPVLAQVGPGALGGNGRNRGNIANNGANQALGGGFGGGGFGGGIGGIGGGGGGFFDVGPERARKLKVVTVCLEHGKQEPSPRVAYELVPIENVAGDAKVIELVKLLGRGEIDQRAAQAAAWHLANGLSWQELADKIGVKHLNGTTESYFSSTELDRARQATSEAASRARDAGQKLLTLGDVSSLSSN
jgi:hypothetical protein